MTAIRDLIFYSLEPWDDVWRRNQFIVDVLVRRNPHLRVLFVAPPANVARPKTRLKAVPGPLQTPIPLATHPQVFHVQPYRLPFEKIPGVHWMNNQLQRIALLRWMKALDMQQPVLWINDHNRAHLARQKGWATVIYDVTDDWAAATMSDLEKRRIEHNDAELCQLADATIVCSTRLFEMKQKRVISSQNLHLIANGVHAADYATVRDKTLPIPTDAAKWPKPVYGYTGTLHADRVDIDLVEAVARQLTQGSLVFVGPDHLSEQDRQRLLQTGRVFLHPAVAYRQIPAFMRAMDVLMVPHRQSLFVESLNPIKLWEYLASGLPVVATDIAGFRDFPDWVRLASDADAFTRALVEAAQKSADHSPRRMAAANEQSWDQRVDRIERLLSPAQRQKDRFDPSPSMSAVSQGTHI